jgi:hypothetical protein
MVWEQANHDSYTRCMNLTRKTSKWIGPAGNAPNGWWCTHALLLGGRVPSLELSQQWSAALHCGLPL